MTISRLARLHGLSRSTLLYYDRLGLLRPSARSEAGYRCYSPADADRLARICRWRQAGMELATIKALLDRDERGLTEALVARLAAVEEEMLRLRGQQRFILDLLEQSGGPRRLALMTKEHFVSLLEKAGFTDADMERWHATFERTAPEDHQQFLEFLGINPQEIRRIRQRSASL